MPQDAKRGRGLSAPSPMRTTKRSELPALAAALALAGALAGLVLDVLGLHGNRAAALALARVLAVRTLALTSVVALTNVGFGLGGLGLLGVLTERLAASEHAG